jgi:hypothetical protein
MEILEALGWDALGFVPTLAALEIATRRIEGRKVSKAVLSITQIGRGAIGIPKIPKPKESSIGIHGVTDLGAIPAIGGYELAVMHADPLQADFEGFAPLPELLK